MVRGCTARCVPRKARALADSARLIGKQAFCGSGPAACPGRPGVLLDIGHLPVVDLGQLLGGSHRSAVRVEPTSSQKTFTFFLPVEADARHLQERGYPYVQAAPPAS